MTKTPMGISPYFLQGFFQLRVESLPLSLPLKWSKSAVWLVRCDIFTVLLLCGGIGPGTQAESCECVCIQQSLWTQRKRSTRGTRSKILNSVCFEPWESQACIPFSLKSCSQIFGNYLFFFFPSIKYPSSSLLLATIKRSVQDTADVLWKLKFGCREKGGGWE